ncbi:hypothetical protein IFM89_019679 [Coptis chinensis]|uniref:Dolichyl-diphosphooligosaccharide--protein glycosyltransferase subunit DAD1 n=1 Tax=Coptis chinensis TaxID=261450 RepID=A0A835LVX2_9MAGN|nr:hypothetical protein IFM89_019679 [Coptis chinensis]
MARSSTSSTTTKDAQALFQSLRSAYASTPTNLKVIIFLPTLQYLVKCCLGLQFLPKICLYDFKKTDVVSFFYAEVCLRIQVNKENKEFKDLPPERAFADFVLCNLVLHLVIMNFLG